MSAAKMRIPRRITFGNAMASKISNLVDGACAPTRVGIDNPDATLRRVLGFPLAPWQRERKWTREQNERFITSVFAGVHLGTFVYNESLKNRAIDGLLVDGQQRLFALEDYVTGKFGVRGEDGNRYLFTELTDEEQRHFYRMQFGYYIVQYDTEEEVARLYNILNFYGTQHEPGTEAKV